MGPNGIHLNILKKLADIITRPHSIVFQWSWKSGDVPIDLRLTNVIPILTEGKKKDPGYNRLVSFSSVPGKIIEKIIL